MLSNIAEFSFTVCSNMTYIYSKKDVEMRCLIHRMLKLLLASIDMRVTSNKVHL